MREKPPSCNGLVLKGAAPSMAAGTDWAAAGTLTQRAVLLTTLQTPGSQGAEPRASGDSRSVADEGPSVNGTRGCRGLTLLYS